MKNLKQNWKLILLIIGIVILCIIVAIDIRMYVNSKIQKSLKVNNGQLEIKYTRQSFSEGIKNYLLSERDIGQIYGDKKIAIYYTGYDCPFAKNMSDVAEPLGKDEKYSSKYFFHPEAAAGSKFFLTEEAALAFMDFSDMCQQFCIVNPAKKQIIRIDEMDAEKAKYIPEILNHFKNW